MLAAPKFVRIPWAQQACAPTGFVCGNKSDLHQLLNIHGRPCPPYVIIQARRGVAQPGSAFAWGAKGRGFKSRRPDH